MYGSEPYIPCRAFHLPGCIYCWFSILAILAFMKKYENWENKVSRWMSKNPGS